MKSVQTVKFSTTNPSNAAGHNADDMTLGSSIGTIGPNSQSYSYAINSSEVVVELSSTTHTSGSSAVATRNITNYPWELVYIPGNLVAVHSSGCFIAYAVQAPNSTNGIVRIISRRTAIRGLIKNIPGLIKDLSFAYLTSRILLAFTDEFGTLFVYEIQEEEETLGTELLIEVKRDPNEERSDFQRVIWCPFIPDESADGDPDESDDDNFAYLLVVTNGPLAEIWHIMTLMRTHGSGLIDHSKVEPGSGHQVMEQHEAPISDAAFSPDGTALATASLDGNVKFFQVILNNPGQSSPRCLHQWKPHDGKPLSCLFFLDNHKNPTPDVQFWKYAVTGALNNTEIKTWSCETWQCNQVISFQASPESKLDASKLSLKAAIDPSSRHLILSDIYRRVLYVLVVNQESANEDNAVNGDKGGTVSSQGGGGGGKVGVARIISISELPVQYPAIFLSITDAEWKPYKRWKHEHPGDDCFQGNKDDAEDDCDENDIVEGLVLKCILINTKSLQDATIRFQPALPLANSLGQLRNAASNHNLSLSEDSVILKDGLTDMSINLSSTLNELETSKSLMSENVEAVLDSLVSFSSRTTTPKTGPDGADGIHSRVSPAASLPPSLPSSLPPSIISSLPCVLGEAQTAPILSSPTISNSVDCSVSNQPVTMNLLTPESFSSPGRTDDDLLTKKENDVSRASEIQRDKFPKATPSPSEDLKSAALSLMLRVNSGSRLPTADMISPGTSMATLASQSTDNSIMDSVVSGSSRSPSVGPLPPPPKPGISPLPQETEDAPLATSEVSRTTPAKKPCADPNSFSSAVNSVTNPTTIPHVGSGVGLASSTSSPSLEVQQILHLHNSKNGEDFADEEGEVDMEGVGTSSLNGGLGHVSASQANSLQELINITSGSSKIDVQKINQSPLIDMFSSLKNFSSSHLMDSGLQQASPLCDSSVINVTKLTEVLPSSSLAFGTKDANDTLPLFKSISVGKNHLTCEELEAEIKCTSPSGKKPAKSTDFPASSTNSLSTFVFPMNLGSEVNGVSSSLNTPVGLPAVADAQLKKYEKSMEEIASLREFVISSQQDQEERTKALMTMTRNLANQVDRNAKNVHQIAKSIEEIRKNQNKLQDGLSHAISIAVRPIIEGSVRQEVKSSLAPALNKCLEPTRSHLNSEIRNLVSNSEAHLAEELAKATCSRQMVDNMSSSIASALSASVQTACRDAYNKVVVPGFNAITQQVFSQLNEAFTRGTKEYMQHVENESQTTRNTLLENLAAGSRTLDTTNSTLSTNVTILIDALHKSIAQQTTVSDTLNDRLKHCVHDEIARALQEHHAAVEARTSRAQTPASLAGAHTPSNPKIARQQVQQLLSQEQFNLAFKQALSASDLSLVVFVCERINPQTLFSQTPCPLSQDVLLSLVNQLSHDLSTFTDLKTKYLEEAVMNLDTTHPVTREHMRKVLQEFQLSLSSYLEHNPIHNKKLKMLLLAVNHLASA